MLTFQTLYIGVSLNNGPSLYTIIPMIELLYGIWYIEGGMHTMAKAMEKLFYELGGKIHFDSPVEEILIKDGKAKGVQVHNQSELADHVICNAEDRKSTRLNSSHVSISYAVFCLKKKKKQL